MSMFTLGASHPALRTALITLFFAIPAIAIAADNGGAGTPQANCEQQATSDYQTNIASCEKNLAGDPASIQQCKTDFSYEYQQALQNCKSATLGGSRLHGKLGTFGPKLSVPTISDQPLTKAPRLHH